MTKDRWQQLIARIEEQFSGCSISNEELTDGSGGYRETAEFNSPLGEIRLEFVEKPRLIGEKTTYSRRIGGDVQVEKQYDPEETVSYMNAYKKIAGDWEPISADQFV